MVHGHDSLQIQRKMSQAGPHHDRGFRSTLSNRVTARPPERDQDREEQVSRISQGEEKKTLCLTWWLIIGSLVECEAGEGKDARNLPVEAHNAN